MAISDTERRMVSGWMVPLLGYRFIPAQRMFRPDSGGKRLSRRGCGRRWHRSVGWLQRGRSSCPNQSGVGGAEVLTPDLAGHFSGGSRLLAVKIFSASKTEV